MKNGCRFLLLAFTCLCFGVVHAQTEGQEEKLNLPGDNLNLYAVMKMFQESETLEVFEKKLNEEDNRINNLDLNGDDQIDYIKVLDEVDGDVHAIILQVALSEKEKQDVAVFTVEKIKDGQVRIQLTGDEELYGKDYIIEPNMSEGSANQRPNPGYTGKTQKIEDKIVVANSVPQTEIATWPVVVYMYQPTYVVWQSPYYWGYYPPWWRPWRPWYWHQYYGYHYNWYHHYYGFYRRSYYHYYPGWNVFYYSNRRSVSITVTNRRRSGYYRNTYSRPELRRDGMAMYTKQHPERPVLKPGVNRPPARPTPSKPVVTRPAPSRPAPSRPAPTKPAEERPVTRPTRPVNKPTPSTRPTAPATRPAVKPAPKPSTRPAPATRPAAKKPGGG
jgi:hypothetical protein